MKKLFFILMSILFVVGCQQATESTSEVSPADPAVNSGTRVFTFSGDTAFTLVFVDSVQRVASVHSLNSDLRIGQPLEVILLSAVEDTFDVEKLRALFDAKPHNIYILELGDRAIGDICCNTLRQSKMAYKGTGVLECSYFGWGEVEEESDDEYLPKVMGDEYNIAGIGTVKNLESGKVVDYEARCCYLLNLEDAEESNLSTKIIYPVRNTF